MDKIAYLRYVIENKITISISTVNGKKYNILPYDIQDSKLIYHFINGTEGQIRLSNIVEAAFINQESEEAYHDWMIKQRFTVKNPKAQIEAMYGYYRELLAKLKERSAHPEIIDFRMKVYEDMFAKKNLYSDEKNLLIQYLLGNQEHLKESALSKELILLLQQSNQSQKRCVENALENRVSVIEGPPGTGKTTTILSIIANMVWRGQKVLVVSKNNSAIDNIAEELSEMDLPKFFIRLGNDNVMREAGTGLKEKLQKFQTDLDEAGKNISKDTEDAEQEISQVYGELVSLETELNELVLVENEMKELHNQLRHLEKRREAYDFSLKEKKVGKKPKQVIKAKQKIEFLNTLSIKLSQDEKVNLLERLLLLLFHHETLKRFQSDGVYQILFLEEMYLRLKIEELENILRSKDAEALKKEIAEIYVNRYIPLSKKVFSTALVSNCRQSDFFELYEAIENAEQEKSLDAVVKSQKDKLISLYPVVLTTVDSVQSNFYRNIKNREPIDVVVIDEASQCDILSALPLLFLAKRIVVVGDSRQLEAIKGLDGKDVQTVVEEKWDYLKQSFLTSVTETMKPPSNMLLEHYRCDYNIINYCNKYFYDGQLIAYRAASGHAMGLINADKGKYVDQNNGSFYNKREIFTIDKAIGNDITNKFVITPFKEQARHLSGHYDRKRCGTIHTFQGKGEQEVYFTTVLNDTEEARCHLSGEHNLFSKELINVAVSRAKERFVMVSDVDFFKKYDQNVADLIQYIEVYGEKIPDKTVCLFDYLYRSMRTYQPSGKAENPFEEMIAAVLEKYTEECHLNFLMKLPLASVVLDKEYLRNNPEIKRFIENHAHLDYIIYDNRINRPLLVIELDGKSHKLSEQMERDQKKEAALAHMGIPLHRISSKEALEEGTLREVLDKYCKCHE